MVNTMFQKYTFLNGCFDVLHIGHIRLLKFAKNLGGVVVVALDSDERVKILKGANRPINTLDQRMEMMKSIRYVDKVVSFNSDEELRNLIKKYKPIMVKGSDYNGKPIIGEEFTKEICFFSHTGHSTTKTLQGVSTG